MRLVLFSAVALAALGALAGTSRGSAPKPLHATAPRLVAHDVSSAFPLHRRARFVVGHRVRSVAPRRVKRSLFATTTSVSENFSAPSALTGTPPATPAIGDIGRTQYLQAIAGNYAVYSRVGGYLSSVSNTAFWSGIGGSDAAGACASAPSGAPAVAYDRGADRWVVAETAGSGGGFALCLAVSTGGDAAGTWDRYVFQVSSTVTPSGLSLGVWPDGYYLAFDQSTSAGWHGAGAMVVDRQSLLTNPATDPLSRYFDLSTVTPGLGGLRVASQQNTNDPDSGTPGLYVQAYDDPLDTNDRLEIWGFHVDWTAPTTASTFTRVASVSVPAFTTASGDVAHLDPTIAPPGTYALPQLGSLEYYRAPGGTQTLTVSDALQVGTTVQTGWYRLTNGGAGWSLAAHGPYAQAGLSPVGDTPAASFDGTSVGIAFSLGSALDYTAASDGTVGDQTVLGASGGSVGSLTLDPLDGCTFWATGPTVAAFSFSTCTPSAAPAPVLTADPSFTPSLVQEGQTTAAATPATFTGASSTANEWLLCDLTGLNCVAIAGATGTTYVPTAADADGQHTLRFATVATDLGGDTSTAISSPAETIESIPPANTVLPSISGTVQVGSTLTAAHGTWTSSSPLHYTYQWQRCTSGTCSNVVGATASTYSLTSADLGSTVDVIVGATNTGGGVDATSAQTAAVAAAPVSSGGSSGGGGSGGGGGGGGGTGGSLDLSVTGSLSPAAPSVGGQVEYSLQVNSLVAGQLAQGVSLTVALPSGETYATSQVDRGSGCTANGQNVSCYLDFLNDQARVAHVYIWANVGTAGPHTLTATVTAQQSETSLANNTLTLTDGTAASTSTTASTPSTTKVPTGLNGSTGAGSSKTDKTAPTTHALSSAARRGTSAKLRFTIYDNSGTAKATTVVLRSGRVVGHVATGFGPVAYGSVYYAAWRVPVSAPKGSYSFCVVATDRAGLSSKRSCAPLAVR